MTPRLMIVIGSTRPGRAGASIAEWFTGRARDHGGFDTTVADLAELDLPLLDEPALPRLRQYTRQHTREWSARVEAADAVVFVTPEYNFGYPAAVKNAIDYLHAEWHHKPVGFVSYGGVSAGTRAVQQLKQVVTTLRMLPVVEGVNIAWHPRFISDGLFHADEELERAAAAMLDELVRTEAALRPLRPPGDRAASGSNGAKPAAR
ncbi:NAD(P)H-dependent oxidoreductase [Actinocorallia longicatena]|uniref:NADPH-dependent FMN reductase n=1 Tax=Actinocorallia longicatena TaxID=111803 RepID=A0ABP6PUY2_9ACTN